MQPYFQVKDDVPKICDFGFARPELFMTGTFVGTITHMAPEVIEQKPYDFSADIYSLGILLWEFWYGRRAYSEDAYKQCSLPSFLDKIKDGERPLMDNSSSPITPLQNLLKKCWNGESAKRPTASEVKDVLLQIFKDSHCHVPTDAELLYNRLSSSQLLH